MSGPHKIILLSLVLAVYLGFDLARMMRSGVAHGKFGNFTRNGQPRRFQRYLHGHQILLALCVIAILWAIFSPETFER